MNLLKFQIIVKNVSEMRGKLIIIILMLVVLVVPAAEAQTAHLSIIGAPTHVEVREEFSFTVQLNNAQGYNYFTLTGEKPDGTPIDWGMHVFSSDYVLYTRRYGILLKTAGFNYITVSAGALFGGVTELTVSFSIYVEEETQPPDFTFMIVASGLGGIAIIIVIIVIVKKRKNKGD